MKPTPQPLAPIAQIDLITPSGCTPSTARLRAIAKHARTPYVLLNLSRRHISITPSQLSRLADMARDTGAAMIYTDYFTLDSRDAEPALTRLEPWQPGCLRETMDFGDAVLISTSRMRVALSKASAGYDHAGFYDLWLRLSRAEGGIFYLPEPIYTSIAAGGDAAGEAAGQFDYVDAANQRVQDEYQRAFIAHLKAINAWLPAPTREVEVAEHDYPVVASVVIAVRNRVTTIADAVKSALAQQTDFAFNVLVVDNHSTDGTSELLRELSIEHKQLVRIEPRRSDLGIGGCWNEAVGHRLCGAYAVQLDSDDLYDTPAALQQMVDALRSTKAAMAVGAYRLTDFGGATIAPGVIDHREWTAEEGHNNLLRVNGIGAPRAFATAIVRREPFPNVSYGEDYAMALRLSRSWRIARTFEPIYACRRWEGNSDAGVDPARDLAHNIYKDTLRSAELRARMRRKE